MLSTFYRDKCSMHECVLELDLVLRMNSYLSTMVSGRTHCTFCLPAFLQLPHNSAICFKPYLFLNCSHNALNVNILAFSPPCCQFIVRLIHALLLQKKGKAWLDCLLFASFARVRVELAAGKTLTPSIVVSEF